MMKSLSVLILFFLCCVAVHGTASGAADSIVVFNEINYSPADETTGTEWIELHSLMGVDVDVSRWRIEGGVDYRFPEGTIIPGRGYLLIALDPSHPSLVGKGALGPWEGRLNNAGEELRIINNNERVMERVNYGDGGDWPVGPDGSGATLVKINQETADSRPSNWTHSETVGGTPGGTGSEPRDFAIVALDSDWKYEQSGAEPPANWNAVGFDDSAWLNGKGALYAERAGDDLPAPFGQRIELGAIAYYFRHSFNFDGDPAATTLALQTFYDDGLVVYLNGVEVFREEMPAGAPTSTTLASSSVEPELSDPITIPAAALVKGANVIAVEVHQSSAGSSDMAFGATLAATEAAVPRVAAPPRLAFNEVSPFNAESFQIELVNLTDAPLEVGGFQIRASTTGAAPFVLPQATLAAGEFVVFDSTQLGFRPADNDRLFLFDPSGQMLQDARGVTGRLRGRSTEHGGEWLYPTTPTFGSSNIFTIEDAIVINEIMYNPWPISAIPAIEAQTELQVVIDYGDNWRYDNTFAARGAGWASEAHADWTSAPGPLGFDNSVLPIPIVTELPNPNEFDPRVITFYFESDFMLTADQLANVAGIKLTHTVDDGAVFYVNGTEILRFAMPDGEIGSETLASAGGDAEITESDILPADALVVGLNRVSVEVHQSASGSSDYAFGCKVELDNIVSPASPGRPFSESDEQWVELYNKGAEAIDLTAWSLEDGINFDFPEGTTMAPGSYLVIAKDLTATKAKYPAATIIGEFGGTLSRSGDRLVLSDASGNPADVVEYFDGGSWPILADGGGSSLELRDPNADNSKPGAWAASDESGKSVWQTFTHEDTARNLNGDPTQYNEFIFGLLDEGSFLIDDISVIEDPGGDNIEMIQNGDFSGGNADKWRLLGTHRHGQVVSDPSQPGNDVLRMDATGSTEHMHNHAETTFANGERITASATYRYSFRARWLGGSNKLHTRLYFNRIARSNLLPVPENLGTPGAANSTAIANAGPTYAGLIHSPAVPPANTPFTVSVDAADPDGVTKLELHYSVDGADFQTVPMASANGVKFVGTIPAQSADSIVQFYVEGTDAKGAASMEPFNGPDSRALIRVDDGDAEDLDYINNFRITMTAADADFLHEATNVMSNDRLGATVIYNESEIYYNCGVRLKGSQRGRNTSVRVGFNVAFPPQQPFLGTHRTVGVDRSGAGDQFSQKEIMVKHGIYHAGGVVGSMDDLIRVISPTPRHIGSAMLVKSRYDDELMDNQFQDGGKGPLYEYELIYYPTSTTGGPEGLKRPNPDSVVGVPVRDIGGDDKELYRWHWLKKNNRDADDYSALIKVIRAIGQFGSNPSDEKIAEMDQLFDMDMSLRSWAIQVLFGIGDSYANGSQHNGMFYIRPEDGKGLYLPWDMDFTFSQGDTNLTNNGDLRNFVRVPKWERAYLGHLQDIIATTFNRAYMEPWEDHYSTFLPRENLNFAGTIDSRARAFTTAIARGIPEVDFEISTASGTSVDGTSITLEGKGWVNVRNLRLAGNPSPLKVEWIDEDTWQINVPVVPGANNFTVEAYDFQGAKIGEKTVAVTGTGTIAPATKGTLVISELMYHPADGNDFEFVEVQNISTTQSIELSGVRFDNGIDYEFGSRILAPGEFAVIAGSADAFASLYPGVTTEGSYQTEGSNRFSDGGEQVELVGAGGETIASFRYDNNAPWPVEADGQGASLVLIAPETDPDPSLPENWRASSVAKGTPGAGEEAGGLAEWQTANNIVDLTADEDDDGLSNLLEYALGTAPRLSNAAPVTAGTTDGAPTFGYQRNQVATDVAFTIEASANLIDWAPAATTQLSSTPNGDGTLAVVVRIDSQQAALYYRMRVSR
ncbi:MAG: lamin tail domain-containing protein [Verrucomicrobiae bacterium]|nr:lamin tail domain-containing protein [Verrucomicrobiae bacterium]